jgi:predicted HTH domain antitoxin
MNQKAVNMNLPEDILFEINSMHIEGKTLEDKLKLNLAIGFFVSRDISLGKAAQLAGKSLSEFINTLNHLNIPAVEYSEEMYEDDIKFAKHYESKSITFF